MSKKKRIRPLALCVFRRKDFIFVSRGYDEQKDQVFYRPAGGKIEFGERAIDTVRREIQEEIQADVTDLVYLGTLENIFTYNGTPGHEIVMVFDGRFVDEWRNVDDYTVEGQDDGEVLYTAHWIKLSDFRQNAIPLYPDGLLELLESL